MNEKYYLRKAEGSVRRRGADEWRQSLDERRTQLVPTPSLGNRGEAAEEEGTFLRGLDRSRLNRLNASAYTSFLARSTGRSPTAQLKRAECNFKKK